MWIILGALGGLVLIILLASHLGRGGGDGGGSGIKNDGYEWIGGSLYMKDDELFYNRTTPVVVLGVSEITKNTRLVQLEIRYRVDGGVKSDRIWGSQDELLTIEYRLGYGG